MARVLLLPVVAVALVLANPAMAAGAGGSSAAEQCRSLAADPYAPSNNGKGVQAWAMKGAAAEKACRAAVAADAKDSASRFHLCRALEAQERYTEAAAACWAVLTEGGAREEVVMGAMHILSEMGMMEKSSAAARAGVPEAARLSTAEIASVIVPWLNALAEKGYPPAFFALGVAHKAGYGVAKDTTKARTFLEKAAAAGHGRAMHELGIIAYNAGRLKEAFDWYRKGAEAGFPRSMYDLGHMHAAGEGTPRNPALGLSLFRKAADAGEVQAQAWMASLYANGWLVDRNLDTAYRWAETAERRAGPGLKKELRAMMADIRARRGLAWLMPLRTPYPDTSPGAEARAESRYEETLREIDRSVMENSLEQTRKAQEHLMFEWGADLFLK